MTHRTKYPDGAPCWADLVTPDRAGALRFYGPLLGWTFDEPDPALGGYLKARRDGLAVAGVMQLPPGQSPVAWTVHLTTSDLAASARKITEAGGKIVLPGHPVAELGGFLLATDPSGALFGLWQPGSFAGAERFDEPGALCWAEVCTRDGAACDRFYAAVLGVAAQAMDPCDQVEAAIFSVGGEQVFMRVKHLAGPAKELPPHWLAYFAIDDMDAALARLPALEGKLLDGPRDTPHGRIAVVRDPYGAAFAIVQRPAAAR